MNKKYAYYDTEIGTIKIGYIDEAITDINIIEKNEIITNDTPCALSDTAAKQINEYLKGKRKAFDLKIQMSGTPFQLCVWQSLKKIPYGQTKSYKQIAEEVGSPKAFRAVGMANNKNPILIVIPCHRVIGSDGSLTGYAYGTDLKQRLLDLERHNC